MVSMAQDDIKRLSERVKMEQYQVMICNMDYSNKFTGNLMIIEDGAELCSK